MEPWIMYALLSTLTGGAALVFAKMGMKDANEHIALVIRTGVLFLVIVVNAWLAGGFKGATAVPSKALGWFLLAGLSTAVYWIFYFKAMKTADVSLLASIDKAGIVVTFLLSALLLNEVITLKLVLGTLLILAGTFILIWK